MIRPDRTARMPQPGQAGVSRKPYFPDNQAGHEHHRPRGNRNLVRGRNHGPTSRRNGPAPRRAKPARQLKCPDSTTLAPSYPLDEVALRDVTWLGRQATRTASLQGWCYFSVIGMQNTGHAPGPLVSGRRHGAS